MQVPDGGKSPRHYCQTSGGLISLLVCFSDCVVLILPLISSGTADQHVLPTCLPSCFSNVGAAFDRLQTIYRKLALPSFWLFLIIFALQFSPYTFSDWLCSFFSLFGLTEIQTSAVYIPVVFFLFTPTRGGNQTSQTLCIRAVQQSTAECLFGTVWSLEDTRLSGTPGKCVESCKTSTNKYTDANVMFPLTLPDLPDLFR